MAVPQIAQLPPVPNSETTGRDVFTPQGDALLAALNPMIDQTNLIGPSIDEVVTAMQTQLDQILAIKDAAQTGSITAGVSQASAALSSSKANAIRLAVAGVTKPWSAAVAGKKLILDAAGKPSFGSEFVVGQVLISARAPGPLWVKANTRRAISTYPTLYAALKKNADLATSWNSSYAITGAALAVADIASANGTMIIAFSNGSILRSRGPFLNNSSPGTVTTVASGATFLAISGDGNGQWIITTTTTTAYRSLDDGVTWTSFTLPVAIRRLLCDGNGVWVGLANGANINVYFSYDNGATWVAVSTQASAATAWVDLATDGKGVWSIVGSNVLRRTADNGNTWNQPITGNASYTFATLETNGQGTWLVSGTNAVMNYRSVDGGITWVSFSTQLVTDMAYNNGFFYLLVPGVGVIVVSDAGDATTGYAIPGVVPPTTANHLAILKSTAEVLIGTSAASNVFILGYPKDDGTFRLPDFNLPAGLEAWIKAGNSQGQIYSVFANRSTGVPTLDGRVVTSQNYNYLGLYSNSSGVWRASGISGTFSLVKALDRLDAMAIAEGGQMLFEGHRVGASQSFFTDLYISTPSELISIYTDSYPSPYKVQASALGNYFLMVEAVSTGDLRAYKYPVTARTFSDRSDISILPFTVVADAKDFTYPLSIDDSGRWIAARKSGRIIASSSILPLDYAATLVVLPFSNIQAFTHSGTTWLCAAVNADDGTDMMRSTDSGSTWTKIGMGEYQTLSMKLRSDGVGISVGDTGVFQTTDFGLTWVQITLPAGAAKPRFVDGGMNKSGFILYNLTDPALHYNPTGIF